MIFSTEIIALLALVPNHEEVPAHIYSLDNKVKAFTAVNTNEDCFCRLLVELCLGIASCLPASDTLHAHMASCAFWLIFYDQQFWASRFQPGGIDRPWLCEVRGKR